MQGDPAELLPLLYEAAVDAGQWRAFLHGLSQHVDAPMACLISRSEGSQLSLAIQSGIDPEAERAYQTYYWTIDAFFAFAQRRGFNYPGSIAPSQSYMSDKELLSTEYCNDFLLKFGMFRHCFSLFGKDGVALSNLSIMRSIREEPFGNAEVRVLRFLAPHVQQAIRISERFGQLESESNAKTAALDQFALGVVFLDGTGRILGTNIAAEKIFAATDGLSNRNGHLKASTPTEDRNLQDAIFHSCQIGAARGTSAGSAFLISRRPPAKPLQLVIGPACAPVSGLSVRPSAVVFIHDLSARIRPRSGVLKELYGFTPAESRLACLILDGKSNDEITDLLGISRNTLKTQMKSIFSKAGIRRQSELMRLSMLLPVEGNSRRPGS